MKLTVETNAGELAITYERASAVYARSVLKTVRQIERETVRGLRTSIGVVLGRVSGRMAKQVRGTLKLRGEADGDNALTLSVASRVFYAGVQERGATQQPTSAGHLTVPLEGAANTVRGAIARWGDRTKKTSAFTAREVIEAPGRYGFTGTFTKNGIIFGRLLDHDDIVPLFALKKSVTIPGRHPHALTREFMRPRVEELLGGAVTQASQAVVAGREVAL